MSEPLLELMLNAARAASTAIMEVYLSDFEHVSKADGSPVTIADHRAEAIILETLASTDIPVLAEESAAAGIVPTLGDRFFVVDPLDGTKEFLKRNGEFTVNIALVAEHRSVLGAVYAPVLDRMYLGHVTHGAWRCDAANAPKPIAVRDGGSPLRVVGRGSHPSPVPAAYLARLPPHEITDMGSSLKICLVAE